MLAENLKALRKAKGLSQEELPPDSMWCGRPSPNGKKAGPCRTQTC